MKLRNKETGQVFETIQPVLGGDGMSITELNEKWEDYEEPKEYWGIDYSTCRKGGIDEFRYDDDDIDEFNKSIGNYFETKEEAEEAVEKLKAWKRLKDLGTEILGWEIRDMPSGGNWQTVNVKLNIKARKEPMRLLDLLFGGEQ